MLSYPDAYIASTPKEMWLDRLSGHSTPAPLSPSPSPSAPQSRSYSPAGRRPSHLLPQTGAQRPGFSPRSSSLSLVSNDSAASLLGNARKTNGSTLKQATAVANYVEPLEVLNKLLGADIRSSTGAAKSIINGNDGFAEGLDFEDLTLHEIAEDKAQKEVSYVQKTQTVDECSYTYFNWKYLCPICSLYTDEKDQTKFEDLHRSIRACDDILNSVELNLTKFQNDLGAVSAEIETLQARSTALSLRLENRKVVEKGLGPIVEGITVSPAVVKKISEGAIDEAWVVALNEVEKRSKALDAKSKELQNIKGIADLKPLLAQLVNIVSKSSIPVPMTMIVVLISSYRLSKESEISLLHRSKL